MPGEALFPDLPVPIRRVGSAEGWTPGLIAALRAGLEALPPGARTPPGGPLEIELHATPSPFGMGDGSPERPEWTDGRRRFHLYAYAEPGDRRAAFRLVKLSPAQRETLWRQRALVHALVQRWDDQLRWTRREGWRRITGWQATFERPLVVQEAPLNRYDWAYSRKRGKESASLDLVTFAEEALVPSDALVPGAVPVDDTLPCQELSKLRFLQERLAGLGMAPAAPARCPAYERWSDQRTLSHLEVLFSAPSGEHPESLFGHVLLRLVRKPGVLAIGHSFESVVEIAAVTGVSERPEVHIWKGLTGRFETIFAVTSLAHVLKQNLEVDQRSLRRFRLNLTETETAHLLERIWETERRAYLGYYFLTDNCASQLIWLLNSALDEGKHIETPGTLWVMPTATLDSMANLRVHGEGGAPQAETPLLTYIPDDFLSDQALALEGERTRAALRRGLRLRVPEGERAAWRHTLDQLESPDARARSAAYRGFAGLVERTLAEDGAPGVRGWIYAVIRATSAVERYAADRASGGLAGLQSSTLLFPATLKLPSAEELTSERQREFEHEDLAARAQIDLDRVLRLSSTVEGLGHRPYTPAEREKADRFEAMQQAFTDWTQAEGDVLERHFADLEDGPAAVEAVRVEQTRRWTERGLRGSGYGYFAVGPAVDRKDQEAWGPLVVTREALLRERLGDQRARGFGPQSELRLMDGVTVFRPRLGLPDVPRLDLTLIGFRTLGREPLTTRSGPLSWLGWGGSLDFFRHTEPAFDQRGRGTAQLYGILDASPGFQRFTAIGLGAAVDIDFDLYPRGVALGPRVELLQRIPLPGHSVNAARLEAQYTPEWKGLGEGGQRFIHRADLSVELELLLGSWGERGLTLNPRVDVAVIRDREVAFQEITVALMAEWL